MTAEALSEVRNLSPRKAPRIRPDAIRIDREGFCTKRMFVSLPPDLTAADLSDPEIWRDVQGMSKPLNRYDQVFLVAYDQSWFAEAVVVDSNRDRAILAKPRITSVSDRYDGLPESETHRVVFLNMLFHVESKIDGKRIMGPFTTAQIAAFEMEKLVPREAA